MRNILYVFRIYPEEISLDLAERPNYIWRNENIYPPRRMVIA